MGGFGDVLSKRGVGLLSGPDSCNSTGQPGQNSPKARAVQPMPQPQPLPERNQPGHTLRSAKPAHLPPGQAPHASRWIVQTSATVRPRGINTMNANLYRLAIHPRRERVAIGYPHNLSSHSSSSSWHHESRRGHGSASGPPGAQEAAQQRQREQDEREHVRVSHDAREHAAGLSAFPLQFSGEHVTRLFR